MAANILVIDDDPLTRWSMSMLLTRIGCAPVLASSGVAGIRAAERCGPALVFCDFDLPDGDGFRLLETLREGRPDLPIVLMSACVTSKMEHHAERLGVPACLEKPIDGAVLEAIVVRTLQASGAGPFEADRGAGKEDGHGP